MNDDVLRVAQLSDTHFLSDGDEPEGGFAYDTAEAFEAVLADIEAHHAESHDALDLITVTGDVADHGRAAQYQRAADAFARLPAPVNVCPGNHDQDVAFTVGIGRPGVSSSRAIELGNWCFLFADSNAGVMGTDDHGRRIDPPVYEDRLHRNGSLGPGEAAWIQALHDETQADHVFVWLHHPPDAPVGLTEDAAYAAEWSTLVGQLPKLRGLGAGHTHVPTQYSLGDIPVFVSPALKNNFDLDAETMLPPGWRSYEFADDGSVRSRPHLTDDRRWPRHPLGRAVMALFRGELSYAELDAIVARKRAERAT